MLLVLGLFYLACNFPDKTVPVVVTEKVKHDTDDPAIWYNSSEPGQSIVFGTDKEVGGGLMAFDLEGKIIKDKCVLDLAYPNNVDIEYGYELNDSVTIDIAVVSERAKSQIRIFEVPSMKPIDNGGIAVFEGESKSKRRPMGVGLYKRKTDKKIFLILSRKSGPVDGTYLWQYELVPDSNAIALKLVRKFGAFSGGSSEIEAVLVDDELGYIYYSDEGIGVRKYHADPKMGDEELALFGQGDFREDREGISLWPQKNGEGYLVISDQQAARFNLYPRNPQNHNHELAGRWYLSTSETDGCEIAMGNFPAPIGSGLFVAMSDDRTFQYYSLDSLIIVPKE